MSDAWKLSWAIVGIIVIFIPACIVLRTIGCVGGYVEESIEVSREQFGPRELLRKYSWFKDVAAQLEAKRSSIEIYDKRVKTLNAQYEGEPRSKWARSDREDINIWMTEVAGIKASFNNLAAEYNAQMAKFNWRFTNVGDLPEGADVPLPREFKAYIEE